MKYFRFLLIFIVSLYTTQIIAQEKFTWKGYMKDSLSGETLINASVIINNEARGVTTNQYGYFSFTLPKGNYQIIFSYVGYIPKVISLE